jgi:hypothetical protein
MRQWIISGQSSAPGRSGLEVVTVVGVPRGDHHIPNLAGWPLFGCACSGRCINVPIPIWRALQLHRAGTRLGGHDVSGAGWQVLGRAMQSIVTMVPVWQCGHARNDCPVSASKRSR